MSSADGGGDDASVQVGDTQFPADAEQESLRVQPARLLARRARRPARARVTHDRHRQDGPSLGPRGLPRLQRPTH